MALQECGIDDKVIVTCPWKTVQNYWEQIPTKQTRQHNSQTNKHTKQTHLPTTMPTNQQSTKGFTNKYWSTRKCQIWGQSDMQHEPSKPGHALISAVPPCQQFIRLPNKPYLDLYVLKYTDLLMQCRHSL